MRRLAANDVQPAARTIVWGRNYLLVGMWGFAGLPDHQRHRITDLTESQDHRQNVRIVLQHAVGLEQLVESGNRTSLDGVVYRLLVRVENGNPLNGDLLGQSQNGLPVDFRVGGSPLASVLQDSLDPLDGQIGTPLLQSLDVLPKVIPDRKVGDVKEVKGTVEVDKRIDDQCT
jgi:hypothetical protein